MKYAITAVLLLGLTACASGYSQFYTAMPGATPDAIAQSRVAPPPETPLVERVPSVPDPDAYARYGYAPIGYSSFNSGRAESERNAIAQGIKVGADLVVIVNPAFTGSVTSHVPIVTPTTSTSYTSGSATAYGPGGPVTAYGNATTTTYGSQTNYVPMTVNRYDYGAVYFVKRKYLFGANWRDLTNEERGSLQSNSGVYITAVVDGSPAFQNDILVGDMLVKVDGKPVYGQQGASEAVAARRGQVINLTIFRNGEYIEKNVQLAQ